MPDISLCCTTYNHAEYLSEALDGMLMQKGDFRMEILIHDDASTDGTQDIIRRYAALHPGIIKPILQTENQYSKGIPINETFNFSRAQGKYIALCEGDDYWIDETKLAKQFRYMETHPDCHFCFSNAKVQDIRTGQERRFIPYYPEESALYQKPSREYTMDEMLALSFIPTASFFFRTADYTANKDFLCKPFPYGDLRFKLVFSSLGYAKLIDDDTCVYRLHVPNSALSLWAKEDRKKAFARYMSAIDFLRELDVHTDSHYRAALSQAIAKYYDYAVEYLHDVAQLQDESIQKAFRRKPLWKRLQIQMKRLFS